MIVWTSKNPNYNSLNQRNSILQNRPFKGRFYTSALHFFLLLMGVNFQYKKNVNDVTNAWERIFYKITNRCILIVEINNFVPLLRMIFGVKICWCWRRSLTCVYKIILTWFLWSLFSTKSFYANSQMLISHFEPL